MRILHKLLLFGLSLLLQTSCTGYKNVAYLQNSDMLPADAAKVRLYEAHISPKDLLVITVNTTDPEASAPFNLSVQSREAVAIGSFRATTSQPSLLQYLVNNEGNIEFPVVGTLHVGGLTTNEAERMLCEKLSSYLKETPIVNVRLTNFKVSVLGEVLRPGQFTVASERINVLEALALAGDLTIYGVRDNVKLIREENDGTRQIHVLDLNDANIIYSPYYQLEQNDILYVTPNVTKAKNSEVGTSTSLWFSATSILVSMISLLYNILK